MLTSRPYLARALYEWLLDNEQTPYIVVDAGKPDVKVPQQFVQNGQIVLNIAPAAVRDLMIDNAAVTFGARFSGQPMQVVVPMDALIAIYARENGVGMVFGQEPVMPNFSGGEEEELEEEGRPTLESVENRSENTSSKLSEPADEKKSDEAPNRPEKGKPSLRIVK
ncbi:MULTISPECIES: ClpXP protease specificity-enhancing factor [Salinicola]|jgi:stringent starvation protein B|uniref:ClpXP protease specificity-enhancing factor n=1 Tax=Salinicola TaxID=404432 RepID=UPI000B3F79D9|nr:ClpXP protease specificity-enhancing factor [Salinicola salarius]MEC8916079.1 ClpXP protease specificity-enhancing factor [Pseudomonadota bacterium]